MRRPFKDVRPVGPFVSQSEEFDKELLNRGDSGEVEAGNVLLLEIMSEDSSDLEDAKRLLNEIIRGPLEDYAGLEDIGSVSGKREQVVPGIDVRVNGTYYYVDGAVSGLTIGQVEQFIRQELSGLRINGVNVVKVNA